MTPEQPVRRGRGRPPGSKNKPKSNKAPYYRKKASEIEIKPLHPHDILALDPPEDSPIWALQSHVPARFTPDMREKKMNLFLAAFAKTGVMGDALQSAGVTRTAVEGWRKSYPQFEAGFREAKELAAAVLEREAFNRAVEGWEEPVYQGGQLVGTVKKKSDRILEIMLRARVEGYNPKLEMSGEFKQNKVEELKAGEIESILRILTAAEERGLLDKPEMVEGEFIDVDGR